MFKILNLAYRIRTPDSLLGSICIRKAHIIILSILSVKANQSPRDLG
jgi:hypothetical protein